MTEKVGHGLWALGRKRDRAGDCVFDQLAGAMCERGIRSLDFAGIPGPDAP
jgi:hypothetical protein